MKITFPRFTAIAVCGLALSLTTSIPAGAQPHGGNLCGRQVTEPPAAFLDRLIKADGATLISRGREFTAVRDKAGVIWNFTTPYHPAHPSVACREVVMVGKHPHIRTDIGCNANKRACDQLAADYKLLDKRIIDGIKKEHPEK